MSSINVLGSVPQDHFHCSICANIFDDPVTTPCGHSFCKTCLNQHWDRSEFCQCPTCHKRFSVRPEIGTNAIIGEISVQLKRRKLEIPEIADDPMQVQCEVCTETPFKALKSCLVCQTSYCSVHLEPHLRVPALMRHKLIKPVDNIEDRICPIHDRLLERYCRDEDLCICQVCVETEHKEHEVVSVEEEGAERKKRIGSQMVRVKMMIDEVKDKIKEFEDSSNICTEKVQKEIGTMEAVFTTILSHVQETHAKAKTLIEEKLGKSKDKDEAIIKQLQEEISRLQLKHSELEELLQSDDLLYLLQTVGSPVEAENWNKTRVYSDVCVETLRLAVSQVVDIVQALLQSLTKREITMMKEYKESVTFDPSTAGRRLAVYESGKRVKHHKYAGPLESDNPERFDFPMVFGTTGFTSGRHYWEVHVGLRCDWDLGVAKETVSRKGDFIVKTGNGFYAIGKRGVDYDAHCTPNKALNLFPRPTHIGVYLDYEDGRVSFFDVGREVHIHSFTGETFTEKLYPYFYLYSKAKKSEPMAISSMYNFFLTWPRATEEKKTEKPNSVNVTSDVSGASVSSQQNN